MVMKMRTTLVLACGLMASCEIQHEEYFESEVPIVEGTSMAGDDSAGKTSESTRNCTLIEVEDPVHVNLESDANVLVALATNEANEAAEVELRAIVITSEGLRTYENIAAQRIEPSSAFALEIPFADLDLSDAAGDIDVVIEARALLASGQVLATTSRIALSRTAVARESMAPSDPEVETATSVAFSVDDEPEPRAETAVVQKKLCFNALLAIEGAGQGEDYWTTNTLTVPARGQRVLGKLAASNSWTTFALDGVGCTATQSFATGLWNFRAYAEGEGGGVKIAVKNSGNVSHSLAFNASVSSAAKQTITYTATDEVEAFHLAREVMRRSASYLSSKTVGKSLLILANEPSSDATFDRVRLTSAALDDKWVVAHEVGHWIQSRETVTSGKMAYDNSLPSGQCNNGKGHFVISREYSSAAHIEGFASFWAATVFNNLNQTDCFVRMGGVKIDCEGASTHPLKYLETKCNDGKLSGVGVETDWQRAFWDMVKPWNVVQATPRQVLDLILAADAPSSTSWTANNHFQLIDAGSNAASTPNHVETRWDEASSLNGIRH
jgi:hypothetical protein